jgi:hypothetical protein
VRSPDLAVNRRFAGAAMKRFSMYLLLAACVVVLLVSSVKADRRSPDHYCTKPFKPSRPADEWRLRRFRDDVERYKSCIEEFVEEQETAIKNHRRAANDAVEEWNSFVRYELR